MLKKIQKRQPKIRRPRVVSSVSLDYSDYTKFQENCVAEGKAFSRYIRDLIRRENDRLADDRDLVKKEEALLEQRLLVLKEKMAKHPITNEIDFHKYKSQGFSDKEIFEAM